MEKYQYCGNELGVFESAKNWKLYWSNLIRSHIGARVLDVGAGIGATAVMFRKVPFERWVSIEPDSSLYNQIKKKIDQKILPDKLEIINCKTEDVCDDEKFDTILYIDVLEHIEGDRQELETALSLLERGGKIIISSPAHNFLFSSFDAKIGHFRRYTKKSLRRLMPQGTIIKDIKYVDSIGFFASLANKLFLKTSEPKTSQIKLWDSYLVPMSIIVDRLIGFKAGKSIICVFEKME